MDGTDVFSDTRTWRRTQCFSIARSRVHREPAREPITRSRSSWASSTLQPGRRRGERTTDPGTACLRRRHIGTVPFRSFGPIIDITIRECSRTRRDHVGARAPVTGFKHPGARDVRALEPRPESLRLQGRSRQFDVGPQNWAYADRAANSPTSRSAELPLRTDPSRAPWRACRFFVRDARRAEQCGGGSRRTAGSAIRSRSCRTPRAADPEPGETGFFGNATTTPLARRSTTNPPIMVRVSSANAIYYLNRAMRTAACGFGSRA